MAHSQTYYSRFFRAEPVYSDTDSAAFQVGETIVNLLRHEAVPELLEPVAMATSGVRCVCTLPVANVDLAVAELAIAGFEPTIGPVDRPWGIRTANFTDPDGYVWELSCDIA